MFMTRRDLLALGVALPFSLSPQAAKLTPALLENALYRYEI